MQPVHREPPSRVVAGRWFPEWTRWEQWGCRVRQQRLLLSLTSTLLASFAGGNLQISGRRELSNREHQLRAMLSGLGCFSSALMHAFYSRVRITEKRPVMLQDVVIMGRIHQILIQWIFTWVNSKDTDIPGFILVDITGAISVVYLIVSFLWDITRKRDLLGIRSD